MVANTQGGGAALNGSAGEQGQAETQAAPTGKPEEGGETACPGCGKSAEEMAKETKEYIEKLQLAGKHVKETNPEVALILENLERGLGHLAASTMQVGAMAQSTQLSLVTLNSRLTELENLVRSQQAAGRAKVDDTPVGATKENPKPSGETSGSAQSETAPPLKLAETGAGGGGGPEANAQDSGGGQSVAGGDGRE